MKVTLSDAYSFLKLPFGTSLGLVERQYRHLAYRYHVKGSLKKLQQVFCAYTRIVTPDSSDEVVMDMETMKDLFKNIFGSGTRDSVGLDVEDVEDSLSDSDYSYDEYDADLRILKQKNEAVATSWAMAKELIGEEEKEKRKAEKRRAKKKKRREKKKLEKEQGFRTTQNGGDDGRNETPNGIKSSDEGEGIDPNAAFVKKINKKKTEATTSKIDNSPSSSHPAGDRHNETTDTGEHGNSHTKKSRQIAHNGNLAAHNGDYPEAIAQFTEAIKLEPSDYRFYGNRSYCYDRIMVFDKALSDADKCIELSPEWPKGYFRRGRALAGLKLFSDAEKAFTQVLKLDKTCEEASKELSRVRTQQLIDMGFSAKDAERALLNKNSLQQALDTLLSNVSTDLTISADDVYISDAEDETADSPVLVAASVQKIQNMLKSNPVKALHHNNSETFIEEKKMDPTNPEGLTALWVGNVLPSVSEVDLQTLFNRYGHVSSVRCLPERFCAFVNFKSKEAAGKAMNALQGFEVSGQHLLIKFPDNPIAQAQTKSVKSLPVGAYSAKEKRERVPPSSATKVSGPVNGDECYYWRTTGCQFGSKCRHKHIPESRGIDRKPWHRVK
ncbi:uncharacterized protein [Watersipora subatra]|uniref:uncharacterized protein isoform X2 n=1 Tax=Watersipora subatra TaxID=2589382 RepID=UPI00355B50F1